MRAQDELTRRNKALLEGSYDCVDRVVLNAYMPICHSPGGFRCWWRAWHEGSDAELDDTHLVAWPGASAAACGAGPLPRASPSPTARRVSAST